MRILLTNSPSYIKDMNKRFTYGSRFACTVNIPHKYKLSFYTPYPWSLGYGSSILKQNTSEEIKVLDAQAMKFNEKEFIKEVRKFSPDLIIADLPTTSFSLMMELLKEIKENNGCRIAVSGLHTSGLPMETMKAYPFLDYVLTGEYELVLENFIQYVKGKNKLKKNTGIYFRNKKKVNFTGQPHKVFYNTDFDSLPYPDREDLPVELYHDMEIAGFPTVQMLTSRGCPYQCRFCCSTIYWPGGAYWQRKAAKVVDEMEFVKETYDAKSIYFDDDVVTPFMLKELSEEILKRKLKLPWTFMGSIHIPEKLLKLAAKAGCVGLKFGVESINPKVLESINKKWVEKERVKKFVKSCRKYNLFTHGTFIVGLPQDNKLSLLETLKFVTELDMDHFQVYVAVPLPGSQFYNEAKKNGWIVDDDWVKFDGNNVNLNYPWFSKEEMEEMIELWRKVRHRLVLKQKLKDPIKLIKNQLKSEPRYFLMKIKDFFTGFKEPI